MEYEFKTDPLSDQFRADFSMGHEAFGHWLVGELGQDPRAIEDMLSRVAEIKHREQALERVNGREFALVLSPQDAMVQANSLHLDAELPEGEDLNLYDDESASACGLEDFEILLNSWLRFITKGY